MPYSGKHGAPSGSVQISQLTAGPPFVALNAPHQIFIVLEFANWVHLE
jgi:hypothetical protein